MSLLIDEIVIATTTNGEDDPIAVLAEKLSVGCFRGSEDDVLGRVVGVIKEFEIDVHAEFQGDNVMPDPLLVDAFIGCYLKNCEQYDYVTNGLKTTYPPGQEVAVYAGSVLVEAECDWQRELPREHVGIHIYKRPDKFRVMNIEAPPCYRFANYHLEVDTEADFDVVRQIFEHFLPDNPGFSLGQIIDYLRESHAFEINQNVHRRWKGFRDDS
jgi:spore coat polysaccharide biosynthesis protein SpsF